MNQFFSINRWLLLMRRHWSENQKLYIYGALSLFGAMGIASAIYLSNTTSYFMFDYYAIFVVGLYITGAILASRSFSTLQKKQQGSYYLCLPASSFEKLLTVFIYDVLLFALVYWLFFKLMQWMTLSIVHMRIEAWPERFHYYSLSVTKEELKRLLNQLIPAAFAVQTLFMVGSIYFKRFNFLLTLIALVLIYFLGATYTNGLNHQFFPPSIHQSLNGVVQYSNNAPNKYYDYPGIWKYIFNGPVPFSVFISLFWLTAWFRLREKQI